MMKNKMERLVGRLLNRRLVLWLVTLGVVAVLLAGLGAIFWLGRIKVSYPVELRPKPEPKEITMARSSLAAPYLVSIPRESFQVVRCGDQAEIRPKVGGLIRGPINKVTAGTDTLELEIHGMWQFGPGEQPPADWCFPLQGVTTLRARRLVAAFLRNPSPPAHAASP